MEPATGRPAPWATRTHAYRPNRAIFARLHCREDDEDGEADTAEAAATEA